MTQKIVKKQSIVDINENGEARSLSSLSKEELLEILSKKHGLSIENNNIVIIDKSTGFEKIPTAGDVDLEEFADIQQPTEEQIKNAVFWKMWDKAVPQHIIDKYDLDNPRKWMFVGLLPSNNGADAFSSHSIPFAPVTMFTEHYNANGELMRNPIVRLFRTLKSGGTHIWMPKSIVRMIFEQKDVRPLKAKATEGYDRMLFSNAMNKPARRVDIDDDLTAHGLIKESAVASQDTSVREMARTVEYESKEYKYNRMYAIEWIYNIKHSNVQRRTVLSRREYTKLLKDVPVWVG